MKEIIVRPINENDIKDLNEIRVNKEILNCLLSLSCESLEETKEYFMDNTKSKYGFCAVVTENSQTKTVGYVRLKLDSDIRKRHKAQLSIAVNKGYQKCGIAKKLLESILEIADQWLMLEKVELIVLTENTHAVKLYQDFGFNIEGTLIKDTVVEGTYKDVYHMSRFKKQNRMEKI